MMRLVEREGVFRIVGHMCAHGMTSMDYDGIGLVKKNNGMADQQRPHSKRGFKTLQQRDRSRAMAQTCATGRRTRACLPGVPAKTGQDNLDWFQEPAQGGWCHEQQLRGNRLL